MAKKKYTDNELLRIMSNQYNDTLIFPTQSRYNSKNGLPSYSVYVKRFGSFHNAIKKAGIQIPENEKYKFDTFTNCSDNEILNYLKIETELHLKNNLFLLTQETIDNNRNMPSASVYQRRFGGIINSYEKIGINYYEFNKKSLEKDMLNSMMKIYNLINRTPNSRDLDIFSKRDKQYYSSKTYAEHFGSIYNAQMTCGLVPTKIGMNKSNDDMLQDLKKLVVKLDRVPTLKEIDSCEFTCSSGQYLSKFKSYYNALSLIGLSEDNFNKNNIYYTKNNTKCLSWYELIITEWLENNNVNFIKEVRYKDIIPTDNTQRRFDWVINNSDEKYYVEMFGIVKSAKYDKKTISKIRTCNENKLNLIAIYPSDFQEKSLDEIFSFLHN